MKTKKTSPKASGIGRRSVLKGAGLGAAALAVPTVLVPRKTRAAIKLTTRDPGGPYVAAMGKGFYEPFNKANEGRIEIVGVAGKHADFADQVDDRYRDLHLGYGLRHQHFRP